MDAMQEQMRSMAAQMHEMHGDFEKMRDMQGKMQERMQSGGMMGQGGPRAQEHGGMQHGPPQQKPEAKPETKPDAPGAGDYAAHH
jgi:hypothetical protein